MKLHSIYDLPKTLDRYTLFTDQMATPTLRECLCLSDDPTNPLGFSQFSSGMPGDHCGKKIQFSDLPQNIQDHAKTRLELS